MASTATRAFRSWLAQAARSVDLLSTTGRIFAVESADDMSDYLERIANAAGLSRTLRS